MAPLLPPLIARFIQVRNDADIDAQLACSAIDAVVVDEGRGASWA
jgi:hypothetical protein